MTKANPVKMCSGLKAPTYSEKLKELGLLTLEARRDRISATQVWKILNRKDDVDENHWFQRLSLNLQRSTRLTSSEFNLVFPRANREIRRQFLAVKPQYVK